jgi:glycosyltransferase involved in cell wall biosynthesis
MGDCGMVVKKRIVIISDAWYPQVNGVVTTYTNIIQNIDHNVYDVELIEPSQFKTIRFPFYKEIELSICTKNRMKNILKNMEPVHRFHIATEGPLGVAAKRALDEMGIRYTTAYHTKFPEYLKTNWGFPLTISNAFFNWFHRKSRIVMMPSPSVAKEKAHWNVQVSGKGYDEHFMFSSTVDENDNKILLYVGRVSKEKGIEDFCRLQIPHTRKVVVGNGPDKKRLKKKYPDVIFAGYKFGKDLARYYQSASVFVFPSRTDTFGIVVLEAMACGTPVAAYPVTGPIDQIVNGVNGYTSQSLSNAVVKCFAISRKSVYNSVKNISWKKSAEQFISHLEG